MTAGRTAVEEALFRIAERCYMCNVEFDDVNMVKNRSDRIVGKNFDHNHLTGEYRGAACNSCNRKMVQPRRTVAVYFHNFRGYDNHHIVHAFNARGDWLITPVAQNMEKFMSMTAKYPVAEYNNKKVYINICFRDSYQVLPESLAALVKAVGTNKLYLTNKMIQIYNVSPEIIQSKGVFPYSYFDSFEKLDATALPERVYFMIHLPNLILVTKTMHEHNGHG